MKEGNVAKIIRYLEGNGIFYVTDLLLAYYNIFLIPYEEFVSRFESIKENLGNDYKERMENDHSLILKVCKD